MITKKITKYVEYKKKLSIKQCMRTYIKQHRTSIPFIENENKNMQRRRQYVQYKEGGNVVRSKKRQDH